MQILVGFTRSGQAVEVPVEQDAGLDWLVSGFPELEQRYEIYCMLPYLRTREDAGWLLTAADRGGRFHELLYKLLHDPATPEAIKAARRRGIARTTFDDLEFGRQLVLPRFRG